MRDSNRAKRVQMVLLLPLVMLLSACSVSGGGTLLGKSMSDGVFNSPFSTAEARAVNGTSIEQPVLQTLPVIGAYGVRDFGLAQRAAVALAKIVATTPGNAVSRVVGSEQDNYAHWVGESTR